MMYGVGQYVLDKGSDICLIKEVGDDAHKTWVRVQWRTFDRVHTAQSRQGYIVRAATDAEIMIEKLNGNVL